MSHEPQAGFIKEMLQAGESATRHATAIGVAQLLNTWLVNFFPSKNIKLRRYHFAACDFLAKILASA
jgi:hypothetical protein